MIFKSCISTFLILILFSCAQDGHTDKSLNLRKAEGDRYYGGTFRLNEMEYIKNIFPHNITDAYSYRLASQIYEGLFKFDDESLQVINGIASGYTIDESGTLYTIQIKKGIYFHDDPCFPDGRGREVTAKDVEYCFTRLCTQHPNNQSFSSHFKGILEGADEYYEASAGGIVPGIGVSGITVPDPYTIQLKVKEPNAFFLINLSKPGCFIYPKEAEEKYGVEMRSKAIGTGPFMLTGLEENSSIILSRNPNYHRSDEFGNKLPYLDALSIQFVNDKKTELSEFRKGNLEMIYRLPTEFIIEILEEYVSENKNITDYELQRVPEMMTQFLTFNMSDELFINPDLRKAFNYAIDREKILDFVLNGEGFAPGHYGITPPVFKDYDITGIKGYSLNIDSAKYYMSKAGYPEGRSFPEIDLLLNTEGERNTNVAIEIQKQLKDHLNVTINLVIIPFADLVERSYQGNFTLIRTGWIADFPGVENFLWLFYGKEVPNNMSQNSYPNIARYKNEVFDFNYSMALKAKSIEEAYNYFKMAETELMKDAPIIVLWYDEGYRLVKSYVKNFPDNPMQYRDFSEVYFAPPLITR